jgi:uncharacterized membrane protein YvbJ
MKKEIENPVIDKTQEQETVADKPAKKPNYVIWAVVAIVIVLLIVSILVYINLKNKKANENPNN